MQLFDKFLNLPNMVERGEINLPKRPSGWSIGILTGLLAVWLLGQLWWWHTWAFPYGAQIGFEAAIFGQQFSSGTIEEIIGHLRYATYYPPLYETALGIFHALTGFRLANALLLNFFFVAAACFAVFFAGRRLADDFAGLVAAVLVLGHDMVFALARVPMREIAILAVVGWSLVLLGDRKLLWHPARAAIFALLLGAGMMLKWTFPIYVAIPTGAAFVLLIASERRNRTRTLIMGGAVLAVGFCLCAPWYLGVLDLDYLAVSSANDPHPDPLLWQIPFYPTALGYISLGGIGSAWALLATALLATVIFWRRSAIPASSAFGALVVLFFIPNNAHRHVLGVLPGLVVLVGALAGLVPRRLWLRAPLLLALVSALAWNFVNSSYRHPLFAHDSGALRALPAAECLPEGRRLAERIIDLAVRGATPEKPAAIAGHPLNYQALSFNHDIFPLLLWQTNHGDKATFLGYDLTNYTSFANRMNEIDVLIVTDNVWTAPREFITDQMAAWKGFHNPDWEVKHNVPDDPRRRRVIESTFGRVLSEPSACLPTVHVYTRKGFRPESGGP